MWDKSWAHATGMNWNNVPNEIEITLKDFSKYKQSISESVKFPLKHKYAYILGENKKETKELRKLFLNKNKTFNYPKER